MTKTIAEPAPKCTECEDQGVVIDKNIKKLCANCTPKPTHDAEIIYDSFDNDFDSYNS